MKLVRHSGGAQHAHPESSLDRNPIFNGSWITSHSRAVQDDEVSWKGATPQPWTSEARSGGDEAMWSGVQGKEVTEGNLGFPLFVLRPTWLPNGSLHLH